MKEEMKASMPNYEEMYNNLLKEHKLLCDDYSAMVKEKESLEIKVVVLKEKLDIVHLIFGK